MNPRWTPGRACGLLIALCLLGWACNEITVRISLEFTFQGARRTDEGSLLGLTVRNLEGGQDVILTSYRSAVYDDSNRLLERMDGALEQAIPVGGASPFELAILSPEVQDTVPAGAEIRIELVMTGRGSQEEGFTQGETTWTELP